MKISISVLAYSRVNHLKKVIMSIIKENIKEINVYMDGPENDKILKNQLKIVSFINQIKKKIKINLVKKNKNHGLALSVINAVSEELKKNDAIILIEDDCIPQKGFFKFMYKSLNKYKKIKKVQSICSYSNIKKNIDNQAFFLKRFNPWGWATWKDRWENFNPNLHNVFEKLKIFGKIETLPADLRFYCENEKILDGKQDIWSLSWTLQHYFNDSIVLYPPFPLIKNIGFDGTGIHCIRTNIFNIKKKNKLFNLSYPKRLNINMLNNLENEKFLIENSSKTFFKENVLDSTQPFNILKLSNNLSVNEISYYLRKFIFSTEVIDIHTHLYPSKFKTFYKAGILELLNYHYLIAEFLISSRVEPKRFYKLPIYKRAKLIWNELFIKKTPFSNSTLGILNILQTYQINFNKISFNNLCKEFKTNHLSENDIFNLAGVKQVVMTNDPLDQKELTVLKQNVDQKYKISIRLDSLFKENNYLSKDLLKPNNHNIKIFLEEIIYKFKPCYFSISTNNFQEFKNNNNFYLLLNILRKFNLPLMLLVGVKRNVNPNFKLAGDGLGKTNLFFLEEILRNNLKNNFLVTCLDNSDHFRLIVLARKFKNMKLFGFWWFTNQESIIKNNLNLRLEMLNDNFIPQHSDARVIDQLIYKWNDFRNCYYDVFLNRYKKLIRNGYNLKIKEIEYNVYNHFVEKPAKIINLKK